ncbi:hypothetical protein ES704_03563 [subsurface metagenome]|jgi:hypothetical protein
MPVGKNINLKDKLIKKTTSIKSNKRNVSNTNITHKKQKAGMPSLNPEKKTFKTQKMTFYIKQDLLDKLHNFAWWDRHSLTEAFNIVVNDGLKGKNIKRKP